LIFFSKKILERKKRKKERKGNKGIEKKSLKKGRNK
jgi:hypothetical protein